MRPGAIMPIVPCVSATTIDCTGVTKSFMPFWKSATVRKVHIS